MTKDDEKFIKMAHDLWEELRDDYYKDPPLIAAALKKAYQAGVEDAAKVADRVICKECIHESDESDIDYANAPKIIRQLVGERV